MHSWAQRSYCSFGYKVIYFIVCNKFYLYRALKNTFDLVHWQCTDTQYNSQVKLVGPNINETAIKGASEYNAKGGQKQQLKR